MIKSPPNGYRYQCPTLGVLRTSNIQINPLPAVGTKVYVYEHVLAPDREKRKDGRNTKYIPADSYLDAFDEPLVFRVEGYSEGREHALSKNNWVKLCPIKRMGIWNHSIRTILIATGSFKLVPIEPGNDEGLSGGV